MRSIVAPIVPGQHDDEVKNLQEVILYFYQKGAFKVFNESLFIAFTGEMSEGIYGDGTQYMLDFLVKQCYLMRHRALLMIRLQS